MMPSLGLLLLASVVGQNDPAPSDADAQFAAEAGARLEHLRGTVADWEVATAGPPPGPLRLVAEPVLRFSNPVGMSRDGAVFLWLGRDDRPEAVVQASLNRYGVWVQELSSLSPGPIHATSRRGHHWGPAKGGLEFRPIPDAPKPAANPGARLAQMRDLSRDFAVEDKFQRGDWQKLRPLAKPFARYGKPDGAVTDGALFCLVLTTDPEAYLMIEARAGADGPAWHYALAPSTGYPLRASWKGRPVWDKNLPESPLGPTDALYQLHLGREKVGSPAGPAGGPGTP